MQRGRRQGRFLTALRKLTLESEQLILLADAVSIGIQARTLWTRPFRLWTTTHSSQTSSDSDNERFEANGHLSKRQQDIQY